MEPREGRSVSLHYDPGVLRMTMPTKRDISSFFRRFWPQVLGIATIIALITRIEWLSNVIRQRLSEGMVPEPAGVLYQGNYLLSAQWGWSLAIFIVLLTAGVYVVISSRIGAKEEPTSSELESELSLLQRVRRNSLCCRAQRRRRRCSSSVSGGNRIQD